MVYDLFVDQKVSFWGMWGRRT